MSSWKNEGSPLYPPTRRELEQTVQRLREAIGQFPVGTSAAAARRILNRYGGWIDSLRVEDSPGLARILLRPRWWVWLLLGYGHRWLRRRAQLCGQGAVAAGVRVEVWWLP